MSTDPTDVNVIEIPDDDEPFAFMWTEAPWTMYFRARKIDREAAEHIAEMPYRALPDGDLISLASASRETGVSIYEAAQSMASLASKGFIEWDHQQQGAWLILPVDDVPPAFRAAKAHIAASR